jgi:ATP-dependent Zn protease
LYLNKFFFIKIAVDFSTASLGLSTHSSGSIMKNFLFATLLLLLAQTTIACNDHDLQDPGNSVQVVETSVSTSNLEGSLFVTVFGTFKNSTADKVDNLVVEAKLTDSEGKVIDVLTQPIYGVVVPAGQQVAFRMQGSAAANQNAYSSVQVRVTSGEAHPPRKIPPPKSNVTTWVDMLISWGPMLLVILVWIVLARKYAGKGSTQHRMLDAISEQNALLTRQLVAIESIASAAQDVKGKGEA